jgi:hypothetical protein
LQKLFNGVKWKSDRSAPQRGLSAIVSATTFALHWNIALECGVQTVFSNCTRQQGC